jgi:hypothetical protein
MLRIPNCIDNPLTDGGEAVSPTYTILGISHRPVFYLKGSFVLQKKHIMSCLEVCDDIIYFLLFLLLFIYI